MQTMTDYRFRLAQELRARDIEHAARARLLTGYERPSRDPFRRALGRRIIALGTRLAADPSLTPARSR